ncbi:hypothetical protein XENOCAPTIV_020542 [Xenoophorus captivus]|uniref:WAPL domain-containing protein n=1 Tax=Xenoophorus captivus TaxID=1517983 RepID=A0ABV0QW26_9TELE
MDLDRACLELMIKLLELDQDYSGHQDQLTAKEVEKVKEKIRKLCETVHNKHLDLENITVGSPFKNPFKYFHWKATIFAPNLYPHLILVLIMNLTAPDSAKHVVLLQFLICIVLQKCDEERCCNKSRKCNFFAFLFCRLALRYCEDMIQRYSRALNNSSLSSSGVTLPHCSFSNVGKAVEDCMRAVIGGLGLLINLVEYSSRNRHCLVDMEFTVDDTCLEDSLMQPADPTQVETAARSAETEGDEADTPKPAGALAALVKVETAKTY